MDKVVNNKSFEGFGKLIFSVDFILQFEKNTTQTQKIMIKYFKINKLLTFLK